HYHHITTTEIYPLSLHDALPISSAATLATPPALTAAGASTAAAWPLRAAQSATPHTATSGSSFSVVVTSWTPPAVAAPRVLTSRSEEHTSELQSRRDLVCRLLLE